MAAKLRLMSLTLKMKTTTMHGFVLCVRIPQKESAAAKAIPGFRCEMKRPHSGDGLLAMPELRVMNMG
jgi:hypothetical protein